MTQFNFNVARCWEQNLSRLKFNNFRLQYITSIYYLKKLAAHYIDIATGVQTYQRNPGTTFLRSGPLKTAEIGHDNTNLRDRKNRHFQRALNETNSFKLQKLRQARRETRTQEEKPIL